MVSLKIGDFNVPIHHEGGEGRVLILWPCSALELRRFMKDEFAVDCGEGDAWEGKCVVDYQVDAKFGQPTAVIALRSWDLGAERIAVLGHECFHAAEWFLWRQGHSAPLTSKDTKWVSWEDMAYLIEWIMSRALKSLHLKSRSELHDTDKAAKSWIVAQMPN